MAKHRWTMCCENSIVDARSNNVSLIGLVEQLNVQPKAPLIAMRLVIASLWERDRPDPVTTKCRFLWAGPKEGESSLVTEFGVEMEEDKRRSRLFVQIGQLDFRGPGDYCITTEVERDDGVWEEVYRYPIEVVQLPT